MKHIMRNLITITLLSAAALAAADFMPIAPGNTWTYRQANGTHEFTIRVATTPILTVGRAYYLMTGYTDEPVYVRNDAEGRLVYLDEEYGELPLTPFPEVGEFWFNAPKRTCDTMGQVQRDRRDYTGVSGHYQALSIHYRTLGCADAGTEEELYAENVGMLARRVTSIAGPVTYHLVFASLGPMTIAEVPRTSFHLILTPSFGNVTKATIRLQVMGGLPLRLVFPTTQHYEVVLKDAQNNVVWRWSDTQFFANIIEEKTVTEYTAEVVIPRAPHGVKLPPGTYTVEGWLTTSVPENRFAATAYVQVWDTGIESQPR